MGATNSKIQLRRDTAANWSTYNPTLSAGEPGFETDTGKLKIGDGRNSWSNLDYISGNQQASPIIDLGNGWMYPQDQQSLSEVMDIILKREDNGSLYTGVFDGECERFILMLDRDCSQGRIIGSALNKIFWWEFDEGGRVVCNDIRDPEILFLDLNVEYDILDKDENSQAGLLYIVDQAVKSNANYIKGFTSDGVPFITLVDYANTEGTYISSLAVIKFSFHPSYEDDRGNYQDGTIDIFSCITLLNAYFNCDVEIAAQKTLDVDMLTIHGQDVVSLISEVIDQKDFLPNTASAVANIISNNTSYFVNPIAQTMEYYPSNFNTALLNIMNAACGTSASHVSHLMISEAAVDAKISNVAAIAEGKTNSYVLSYNETIETLKEKLKTSTEHKVYDADGNDITAGVKNGNYDSYRIVNNIFSSDSEIVYEVNGYFITFNNIEGTHEGEPYGTSYAILPLPHIAEKFKTGDILYITEVDVPDRWYAGGTTPAMFYKMETAKVDLANYYTKSEVDALIESKISQYLTSIEADDVEFGS